MLAPSKKIILLYFFLFFLLDVSAFADHKTLTDHRDGSLYKIISINGQKWLNKNSSIKLENSWCPNGEEKNCAIYGRIYTWNSAQISCPKGSHVPSDKDLYLLEKNINGNSQLVKMFEYSRLRNTFGFDAQPGGYREPDGAFMNFKKEATFWTSTEKDKDNAYKRWILMDSDKIQRIDRPKNTGYQVRCILD